MTIYRGPGGSGDATNDATVTAVAAYAAQAATSATNAANSATTSGTSATNSANSASSAAASASAAANSASQAASSQSAAATSATTAASSATSAGTQATNATTQANNAANSATAAATSASNASTSATNAASSASQAATSATNASNSAASALAIYGNTTAMNNAVTSATNSASAAATSASQAAASANDASDEATQAGIYAGQAASSASAAANSAANSQAAVGDALALYGSAAALQTAVTNAQTSATQSANSATASSASSSAAQTSANSAATSATNAANSATQAANSAASAAAIVTGVSSNRPSVRPSLLLDFQYTKQLDPRITFSRPTTATYYDGKTVVKAEENLFTYSQEFDNAAWTKQNATVTANSIAAPDGTTTADSIIASNAVNTYSGVYRASNLTTGNTSTQSAYVKAGNKTFVYLLNVSGSLGVAWFNLGTGTVGTVQPGMTASITSVGGGWYRISATGNTYNNIGVYASDADNSFICTGDGTTVSIYAWGAQLEQRSTVTAYTATTTAPITNYIPVLQTAVSNDARFDHDPVTGESKGLLIEEQRTNLATYSQDYSNATWVKYNSTVASNVMICPDGTQSAQLITTNTAAGYHYIYQSISISAGVTYTASFFVKAGSTRYIGFGEGGDSVWHSATLDTSTGTISYTYNCTATATSVGNGWFKVSCIFTRTSAGTVQLYVGPDIVGNRTSGPSYTGTGYETCYAWGAQLEAGSFPTSYIPTVVSQVTRSADSASMTGSNFSSWYRADEGTLYADYIPIGISAVDRYVWAISNSAASAANLWSLRNYNGTGVAGVASNSTSQASLSIGTISANTQYKVAVAIGTNNFAASANAATPIVDTSGLVPVGDNQLLFPDNGCNTIKRIAYYPKRLSNTELQGLTS